MSSVQEPLLPNYLEGLEAATRVMNEATAMLKMSIDMTMLVKTVEEMSTKLNKIEAKLQELCQANNESNLRANGKPQTAADQHAKTTQPEAPAVDDDKVPVNANDGYYGKMLNINKEKLMKWIHELKEANNSTPQKEPVRSTPAETMSSSTAEQPQKTSTSSSLGTAFCRPLRIRKAAKQSQRKRIVRFINQTVNTVVDERLSKLIPKSKHKVLNLKGRRINVGSGLAQASSVTINYQNCNVDNRVAGQNSTLTGDIRRVKNSGIFGVGGSTDKSTIVAGRSRMGQIPPATPISPERQRALSENPMTATGTTSVATSTGSLISNISSGYFAIGGEVRSQTISQYNVNTLQERIMRENPGNGINFNQHGRGGGQNYDNGGNYSNSPNN